MRPWCFRCLGGGLLAHISNHRVSENTKVAQSRDDADIVGDQTSLFFRAASSVSVVSHEGDQKDVLSFPLAEEVVAVLSGSTKSLTRLIKPAVNSGNKASLSTAIFAGSEIVSAARPSFVASRI